MAFIYTMLVARLWLGAWSWVCIGCADVRVIVSWLIISAYSAVFTPLSALIAHEQLSSCCCLIGRHRFPSQGTCLAPKHRET